MTRNYTVGYRRPPKKTQFKPGQSGNPKGRPKGTLDLKTALTDELKERITVRENGKSRRVNKQTALVKALIAKGMQGDTKAAGLVLNLNARLLENSVDQESEFIDREEEALLKKFLPQLVKRSKAKKTP